jgi:hypothetical protein
MPPPPASSFEALEQRLGQGRTEPVRKARAEEWLRLPITPDVELSIRGRLDAERCAPGALRRPDPRHSPRKGTMDDYSNMPATTLDLSAGLGHALAWQELGALFDRHLSSATSAAASGVGRDPDHR